MGYGVSSYGTPAYGNVADTAPPPVDPGQANLVLAEYIPQPPVIFQPANLLTVDYILQKPPIFVDGGLLTVEYVTQAPNLQGIIPVELPLYIDYVLLAPLSYTPPFPDAKVYMDVRVEGLCRLEVESDPTSLTVTADPTAMDVL